MDSYRIERLLGDLNVPGYELREIVPQIIGNPGPLRIVFEEERFESMCVIHKEVFVVRQGTSEDVEELLQRMRMYLGGGRNFRWDEVKFHEKTNTLYFRWSKE